MVGRKKFFVCVFDLFVEEYATQEQKFFCLRSKCANFFNTNGWGSFHFHLLW